MARPSTTAVAGAVCVVAAPLLLGIGDQLRMAAEGAPAELGITSEWTAEQAAAQTESIAAHAGLYSTASWLVLAGILATVPALLTVWRLTVARSPRLAWVGGTLAMLGVLGQMVHLSAYYGLQLAYAGDGAVDGWQVDQALQVVPVFTAALAPFFLSFLAPVVQGVGLRRAKVVPLWAMMAIVASAVVILVAGSTPVTSAVWTVLAVAGFAPAAAAAMRVRSGDVALPADARTTPVPA